jgi:hypothetical protein
MFVYHDGDCPNSMAVIGQIPMATHDPGPAITRNDATFHGG